MNIIGDTTVQGVLFFALFAVFGMILYFAFQFLGKSARPTRTIVDQMPTYKPQQIKKGFMLNTGIEKQSRRALILPEETLTSHILMLAPTGRGKSTLIQGYLDQIIRENLPVVVFDAQKSETENIIAIAKKYGRTVKILPDEGYNPLRGGATPTERAISFAEVYGQASGLGGGDSQYFVQFSQLFLQTIMPLCERANGQIMILDELLDLLTNEQARKKLLAKAEPVWDETLDYLAHFEGWKQSQFDKSLSGLILFLRRIADADIKDKYNVRNAPTIAELVEAGEIIIVREGGTKNNVYARARGLCFMIALQKYIETRKNETFLPVMLDESHQYFNNAFGEFMAMSRKRNVMNFLAFQSLSQTEDMQNTIISNCNTWFILGGIIAEDAKIVADQIGYRLFNTSSTSHSGDRNNVSEQLKHDYLYQPYQIMQISGNEALILTAFDRKNEPPRFITRPEPIKIPTVPYNPPVVIPDISEFR